MPIVNERKIDAAFVKQFHDSYEIAAGQNVSRLLATVTNRGKIEGESFTINDMDQVEMTVSIGKHSNTPDTIPDGGTRTVLMTDYDLFIPIAASDLPKLKAQPKDQYMQLCLNARNRRTDAVIYTSLIGSVSRTTVADDGTKTVASVAVPASQIIASAFGTLKAQIIKAKAIFRENEADEHNNEELFILYSSAMMTKILGDTSLTSADFMAGKMLQEGGVGGKWMGFNWVPYEKLSNGAGGATERRAVAYTKSALHFGDADISNFQINQRPDRKNNWQVGGVHSFGAGRSNEKKVVLIDFVI